MEAHITDMLEFLKCKPYFDNEDYKQLNITETAMKEFCKEFRI